MNRALEIGSPYYPPRKRWYSGPRRFWSALRRELHLEAIAQRAGMSPGKLILGLLLPGYSLWTSGRRRWGLILALAWVTGLMLFLIMLGQPPANIVTGLVITLHATSVLYLMERLSPQSGLGERVLYGLAVTFIVSQLVYAPLRQQIAKRWAMPLRQAGRVIIVNPRVMPNIFTRGDWVAYRIPERGGHWQSVYVPAGFGLEKVLGVPGNHVVFGKDKMSVNDIPHPRRSHMPAQGELIVPDNHWFIWPNVAIETHNVKETDIEQAMVQTALVAESDLIGVPYRRWFWRRQTTP